MFRNQIMFAGALAAALCVSGCTLVANGGVTVEESDGITFIRARGESGWPDMYYSARFDVGEDNCLYVSLEGGDPRLAILNDETDVAKEGLETSDGDLVRYGEQVDVLRPNADYFDEPLDGLGQCDISERAGVRFDAKS